MDSGLMKITDPGPWPYVELCDPDHARVGDWVLALGHPGGFDAQRSVVVRLGRIIRLRGLVQTDCTLIGGDSGGPLFDMRGHVVGVHSRISESTADNYHVPVGTYLETWDRLVKGETWGGRGSPARSTIGVRAVNSPEGCRLDWVSEDGPASKAGLQPGDIVLRVNSDRIDDAEDLVRCIRQIDPGKEATVRVQRDGTELSVKVKVETRRGRGGRSQPAP
jgi:serine protease Do